MNRYREDSFQFKTYVCISNTQSCEMVPQKNSNTFMKLKCMFSRCSCREGSSRICRYVPPVFPSASLNSVPHPGQPCVAQVQATTTTIFSSLSYFTQATKLNRVRAVASLKSHTLHSFIAICRIYSQQFLFQIHSRIHAHTLTVAYLYRLAI